MGCGAPRAPGWFSQTCHPLWKHKVPNEDVECLLQKRKYKYSRHTNSTQNQPKNDWISQSCHPLWESNTNGPVRRASRLMSVRAWPRFASQLWTSARHRRTTWECKWLCQTHLVVVEPPIWKMSTRWFKVPFSSPSWRSLNPLKGSLNHPKKVTLNHQVAIPNN